MSVSTLARPALGYVKVHARNMPPIQDEHLVCSPNGNPLGLFYFYRSREERASAIQAAWGRTVELQTRFDALRFEVAHWEDGNLSTVESRPRSSYA